LIKELEAKGIGRPSTYATITNTIIQRKYVEKKNKQFVPTELGLTVNKVLISHFESFFNVKFTAEMEESLDEIEYGKEKLTDVLSRYYEALDKLIKKLDVKKLKSELIEETDIVCEKCGSKMVIRWGKNGQFLACSNYPECKNTKNFTRDENGKIVVSEEKSANENDKKLDEKCPKCGGDLVIKKGRYGEFIACSNYPKCRYTRPITTGVKCPVCKDGELVERRSKRGKRFYACTNYPKCKFIMNDKPVNKECPNCNNPYLVEKYSKAEGTYLECPECKTKFKE
jgi:DNA topoisomerase-1